MDGSNRALKRSRLDEIDPKLVRERKRELKMQNLERFMDLMSVIKPNWMLDDKPLRHETEQRIKGVLKFKTTGLHDPLSVTQVSRALGHAHLTIDELKRVEKEAAKRYRVTHTSLCPPHGTRLEVVHDNVETQVNVYSEADRAMLASVLRDLCVVDSDASSTCSTDSEDIAVY